MQSRQQAPHPTGNNTTHCTALQAHRTSVHSQSTSINKSAGFAGLQSGQSPWWVFHGISGGDESLIQETARPLGGLSTGIPRCWFSLCPTTRHCPNSRNRPWPISRLLPLTGHPIAWTSLTADCSLQRQDHALTISPMPVWQWCTPR